MVVDMCNRCDSIDKYFNTVDNADRRSDNAKKISRDISKYIGDIVLSDIDNFSSYRAMAMSHVTTATLSTTLREQFGFGRKVLFCNFTEDDSYDCPMKGDWSFSTLDKELFTEHLKMLLNMQES